MHRRGYLRSRLKRVELSSDVERTAALLAGEWAGTLSSLIETAQSLTI
jgi:hypothetical protein